MSATSIAFFNNKGGVGKTSLVYHLAWMYADLGVRVVAADLDPQANLTAAFLDEDRLEELWSDDGNWKTVFRCVQPLLKGTGDIVDADLEHVQDHLGVLVGDLALSRFEDELSAEWHKCLGGNERAFRVISAFWRIMQKAAEAQEAGLILMDLGPNLGAINRAALIAADYVVVPLSPDLFSLRGLENLGPTLESWRVDWQKRVEVWRERVEKEAAPELQLPEGQMLPVGYVVLQHSERLDRPVKAYAKWIGRIPGVYRKAVLHHDRADSISIGDDPNCLALLKHYRSLVPMAQEFRKAVFHLKPADGAIGSHVQNVANAYRDFESLAGQVAERTHVSIPRMIVSGQETGDLRSRQPI